VSCCVVSCLVCCVKAFMLADGLGCPWVSLGVLGCPWASLGVLGRPWVSLGVLGHPWESLGVLRSVLLPVVSGRAHGSSDVWSG
jgi:hypothetical protein